MWLTFPLGPPRPSATLPFVYFFTCQAKKYFGLVGIVTYY